MNLTDNPTKLLIQFIVLVCLLFALEFFSGISLRYYHYIFALVGAKYIGGFLYVISFGVNIKEIILHSSIKQHSFEFKVIVYDGISEMMLNGFYDGINIIGDSTLKAKLYKVLLKRDIKKLKHGLKVSKVIRVNDLNYTINLTIDS